MVLGLNLLVILFVANQIGCKVTAFFWIMQVFCLKSAIFLAYVGKKQYLCGLK